MKNSILNVIAIIAEQFSIMGCDSASMFGYHQAAESENVRRVAEERRQARLAKKASKK